MKACLGLSQDGLLTGMCSRCLASGSQGTEQFGQRGFACLEGLLEQLRTFTQQCNALLLGLCLSLAGRQVTLGQGELRLQLQTQALLHCEC
jgi:hypothetical protein